MAETFDSLVTYLTGIDAQGHVVGESFATWNGDAPATYGNTSAAAKWGAPTAGTGATISYAFDGSSQWTSADKTAVLSTFSLWSAVANVRFVESSGGPAQLLLSRGTDGGSAGIDLFDSGAIGGTIGTARTAHISLGSDMAFGSDPSADGGYAWGSLVHFVGHALGLGNAGPYADFERGTGSATQDGDVTLFTAMSNRVWQTFAYVGQPYTGVRDFDFGAVEGEYLGPTTLQLFDIFAIQRLYGVATQSPLLGGGVTFGFNSNLTGPLAQFFDFSRNQQPIVTLWSPGPANKLDLSGFSDAATVDLAEGSINSVGGLETNLVIAPGTRIDTVIGGSGDDTLQARDDGSYLIGGSGTDTLRGGLSNDHLYGGAMTALADDGADFLYGGSGSDYLQGNGGNDWLHGEQGSDRIYGGQGDDFITADAGNDSANGNLGNDTIYGDGGNDVLRGGQGNDSIYGGDDSDILMGDRGIDTLDGGRGDDIYSFNSGDALFSTSGPDAYRMDSVTFDFGTDHIHLAAGIPSVLHSLGLRADIGSAADAAAATLSAGPASNGAVAVEVGMDIFLFYRSSAGLEGIKVGEFAGILHDLDLRDFV